MASANAQVGVAVAAYYPDITLSGSISFANTVLGSLFTIGSAVWSIGPQLAGTAIDGGARGAQVEGARANYDRTVALYRQTVLTAFQQVEDGLVQQRLVEQQEKVQQGAVAAAREAERLSLNQYRAGTIPYTTVIQTQTSALSAEQTLINVRLTRFNTSATLVTALGGGWRVQDLPIPAATPSSDPVAAPAAAPKKRSWWPF
jgi:outer membrane protein TolC